MKLRSVVVTPAAVALALLLAVVPAMAGPSPVERSEAVRWFSDYLRIDTSNPPGREHRAASYLADLLHRERIATRLLVSPEGRVSLYAKLEANVPKVGGALLLTHHIDVVPAGEGWSQDPFGGEMVDGRIWGRGAVDTKSLGIAHLAAMIALQRSGEPRARDLIFLAAADEEVGGAQGMGWLIERFPELFADVWAVYNEGGVGHQVQGRVLWWEVEVAQKRPLWLRVSASGRGGHASGFHPVTPVHKLIEGLARVIELDHPHRVTRPAREFLAALAPFQNEKYRRIFSQIDRYVTPDGMTEPMLPGITNLFVDSLQVTVLKGSDSINVIAPEASALIDIRMLPDTDAEALLERVRAALGDRLEVDVLSTSPPSPPSPTDHPAFQALVEELGVTAPVVPSLMAGFTDSRHFRERGIPAYGMSPFALTADDRLGIHAIDEAIGRERFEQGVERMIRIARRCLQR
jgi:acetylornithine deacetylase/succinyl-diaminopimelate desuccinylase-like protein